MQFDESEQEGGQKTKDVHHVDLSEEKDLSSSETSEADLEHILALLTGLNPEEAKTKRNRKQKRSTKGKEAKKQKGKEEEDNQTLIFQKTFIGRVAGMTVFEMRPTSSLRKQPRYYQRDANGEKRQVTLPTTGEKSEKTMTVSSKDAKKDAKETSKLTKDTAKDATKERKKQKKEASSSSKDSKDAKKVIQKGAVVL